MNSIKEKIDTNTLPKHVAIIMDGNRRWAKERGEDAFVGHQHGVASVRSITEAAAALGINYLTLYTFSTENWNRPQNEVDFLMELLVDTIEKETPDLNKNKIRILTIGNLEQLPQRTREKFNRCMDATAQNTRLNLVIALNYSSRWEITNAIKNITEQIKSNKLNIESVDEKTISEHLTTKNIPDPELLIRTSGEIRLSNFLLWQLAYTELYFTETYWPDFREENFYQAIYEYQQRERRFGK